MAATAQYPEGTSPRAVFLCKKKKQQKSTTKSTNKKMSTLKQIYLSLLLLFDAHF